MLKGRYTELRAILRPKRFEAFCVGLPKSGTHSVATMFSEYRSAHEPGGAKFVRTLLEYLDGKIKPAEMIEIIRQRNRENWLEMESAHFDIYIINLLYEVFPNAKYILTIRDCYGWVDSFMNHELGRPMDTKNPWIAFRKYRFGEGRYQHAPEEAILAEKRLSTLDGYFSYWSYHINQMLRTIPAEKLMVIEVSKLAERAADLAEFVGVPAITLSLGQAHSFKAVQKYQMLAQMNPAFVRAKAEKHCSELMHRFFPNHETTLLRKD